MHVYRRQHIDDAASAVPGVKRASNMKYLWFIITICYLSMTLLVAEPIDRTSKYRGQYLGQNLPGNKPEPFLPDIFSAWNDYGLHPQSSPIFLPDGDEMYFADQSYPVVKGRSKSVWYMHEVDDAWTGPDIEPFSSDCSDWGVFSSPEEGIIHFISTRPLQGKGSPKDADIWYVRKNEKGFSEPGRIGHPVNTPFDEASGTVTGNGLLLFSSNRPGGAGGFDIYMSRNVADNYTEPANLGEIINTKADEYVLCAASDLGFLILYRYDKDNEPDNGLYVSFRLGDQSWTEPKSVGDHINMLNATWASLSPDGEYLLFLGQGNGVYWLKTELIDYLRMADLDISKRLHQTLLDHGLESACAEYFIMKNEHAKYIDLDEFFLNQKGYQLLQAGIITQAIRIFRICVALFPTSWNAHDSLAEAYLVAGETELAKTHYRESLDLNPENGNARRRLEELEIK
jgi:hypothetical protein